LIILISFLLDLIVLNSYFAFAEKPALEIDNGGTAPSSAILESCFSSPESGNDRPEYRPETILKTVHPNRSSYRERAILEGDEKRPVPPPEVQVPMSLVRERPIPSTPSSKT